MEKPQRNFFARLMGTCGFAALALVSLAPTAHAEADQRVLGRANAYQADGLALLKKMVNIDSPSGDADGVNQVGALAVDALKPLKMTLERFPSPPAAGDNLVLTLNGKGGRNVLMIAHLDTVFAKGTAAARPFTVVGNKATGPGVADDKSGIVVTVYALRVLHDLGFQNFGRITVLFNTNEETGSYGTRALIAKLSASHDVVLNMEPGAPGDGARASRKGRGVLNLTVEGKASHAGNAPEKGRNAAVELAWQSLKLSTLENKAAGTSVNLTGLTAGEGSNVIPSKASAVADVRVDKPEEFDRIDHAMKVLVADKKIADTTVEAKLVRDFPPMPKNAKTDALIARAATLYAEIGRTLQSAPSGASSDAGFVYAVGTPVIDGLGIVGDGAHSVDETIFIDTLSPRIYLAARLIMELGRPE